MTILNFIEKAISKDKTRPNLSAVWRANGRLYATDGHRLHYSKLEPVAVGMPIHYLDGRNETPPDVEQALPKDPYTFIFHLNINSECARTIKALAGLRKIYKYTSILRAQGGIVYFEGEHDDLKFSFKVGVSQPDVNFKMGLNFNYVYDVLAWACESRTIINVEYRGEISPVAFDLDGECGAVIMPERI